jgi:inhibitor of KinA sporulation pathway (predicted exonuclease)
MLSPIPKTENFHQAFPDMRDNEKMLGCVQSAKVEIEKRKIVEKISLQPALSQPTFDLFCLIISQSQ